LARNQITTVDVGTNSVKILQLEFAEKDITIVGSGVRKYPRQSASEKIPDEVIIDTLKRLIAEENIKTNSVAIAVPRLLTTVKGLAGLPASASEEEIEQMVTIQIQPELPFDITGSVYSSYNIQRSSDGISLEVVAAKKAAVQRYIDIAGTAKMKPKAVIPSSFATYAVVFDNLKEQLAGRTLAVADIGAGITDIGIIRHGRLAISRSISFGGNNLTREFEKEYDLQFQEAEERKIAEADLSSSDKDTPVSKWAENLVKHIDRSLRAFAGEANSNGPSGLLICGGGSLVAGLSQYLSDKLKMSVNLWNPLQETSGHSLDAETQMELSVALGLGIIAADGEKRAPTVNANLLPKEIKDRAERAKRKITILVATAAAILILIGAGLGLAGWRHSQKASYEKLVNELSMLEQKAESRNAKKALGNSIMMQRMMSPYVTPLEVLLRMSEKLPDRRKIALTGLNIDKKGKVTMGVEVSQHADVTEMIQALNELEFADGVRLFDEVKQGAISRITKENRPVFQVQVACVLNADAIQETK